MFSVTRRQADNGVTILDCQGEVRYIEEAKGLRDAITSAVTQSPNILLNFGDIEYVGSAGIAQMIDGLNLARKNGGDLKLLNLTRKVHDMLQITQLYPVFDVHDNEGIALKAFGPVRLPVLNQPHRHCPCQAQM